MYRASRLVPMFGGGLFGAVNCCKMAWFGILVLHWGLWLWLVLFSLIEINVGEAYKVACGLQSAIEKEEWQRIRRFKDPQRYSYTTWLACYDRLMTRVSCSIDIVVMIPSV